MTASATIDIDLRAYRLSAVKKAAYRFAGRCHVSITVPSAAAARIVLTPHDSSADAQALRAEFENEVLDQDLRETVAQETEGVRNLLLAQAFSQLSLIDPDGEAGDFEADPLGVSNADARPARRSDPDGP